MQETASDEMPTLVFDMDSAEAQELMKTAPLPKPDEAGKDPESTIVASGHGLEIKKQDEDYIPRKASAPPPPPTKNKF